MTRIRATCPSCGEVELSPEDVVLRLVRSAEGAIATGSNYRFCCPDCAQQVTKPADERVADLLRTGGVAIEDHASGDRYPEQRPDGPPLTLDDLLDLHLLLEDDRWFDRLVALTR